MEEFLHEMVFWSHLKSGKVGNVSDRIVARAETVCSQES